MRSAVALVLVVGLVVGLAIGCGRLGFDAGGGDDALDDAGGDAPPFQPTWQSGPRIRARLFQAVEGGDPIHAGWHDALLGTDCQAQVATDDVERCLPAQLRIGQIYADSACTVALALHWSSYGTNRYAHGRDASDRVQAFVIEGPYTDAVFEPGPAATCVPSIIPPGTTAWRIGDEEPASSFVPSEYTMMAVGPLGYLHQFSGFTDGARQDLGWISLAGPTRTCIPAGGRLGESACRANFPSAAPVFADAECTVRAYLWARYSYDPPSVAGLVVEPTQMCGSSPQVLEVVADVTAASYWEQATAGCVQRTTPVDGVLYTAVPTTTTYPRGTVTLGPRRGRLGKLYWTGEDGIPIPIAHWDHELGHECTLMGGTDRVLRCLPVEPRLAVASPDAACGPAATLAAACYGEVPYTGTPYTAIDDTWIVRRLPSLASVASVSEDGACRTLEVPPGGVFDFDAATEVVDPRLFPELVIVID